MTPRPVSQQPRVHDGRRVLVVGGSSGIGLATTKKLLAEGARVAAWDVHGSPLPPSPNLHVVACDVTDEDAVHAAMDDSVDWLGGLDAAIQVAGVVIAPGVQVDALAKADWDAVMDVNLRGAYFVVKHSVPHLEATHGVVILTTSGAGIWAPHQSVAYAVSKGGLHALRITLEDDLRARGIRINDVAPGGTDTPLLLTIATAERIEHQRKAGKLTPPERVADVMAFLISPDAAAVRGTVNLW